MQPSDAVNSFRYRGGPRGHYESYFQRANHPSRPLAFWIRYTVFSPKDHPERAVGELWAVYFDGEASRIAAVRQEFPFHACRFSTERLAVTIAEATLDSRSLAGEARNTAHHISWALSYLSPEPPLLLLPERLYAASFPKAKALVGSPRAVFVGELVVDGQRIAVNDWVGSQNHNWGERHTDRYAWAQVAGFEGRPDAFLECATAQVRLGPLWTPAMSPLVLRLDGEELRFTTVRQALKARARYAPFEWHIRTRNETASVEVAIQGRADQFVALPYFNPPGGQKVCLNSKLASCRVCIKRAGRPDLTLETAHRAAFEILTDPPVPAVTKLAP